MRVSQVVAAWEAQVSMQTGCKYTMPAEHKGLLRAAYKRAGLSPSEACSLIAWAFSTGRNNALSWPGSVGQLAEEWRAYEREVSEVGSDIGNIIYYADLEEGKRRDSLQSAA